MPPNTRRLFFALWPDDASREALRRETRAAVRHCGGKPVAPGNYHLTLAFLGNVPEQMLDAVAGGARRVAIEPLTLTLERFGWFPAPQVLWLGPAETPAPLTRLSRDLWAAMAAAGLTPDPRPFHAHLTLARKVRSEPDLPPPRPVVWAISTFALVESETDPEGARYRVIATFPAV